MAFGLLLKMHAEGKPLSQIGTFFGISKQAISKRLKRLQPPEVPESFKNLSKKEQRFALEVADGKTQTDAAMVSHDCVSRDSAKSMGYQLMQKPDIQTAVAEIMQEEGLTRRYRVKKLKSHIDNPDPGVSLKGVDQTWKLDGAYTEKIQISGPSYADVTRSQQQIREELESLGYKIEDVREGEAEVVEDDKEV